MVREETFSIAGWDRSAGPAPHGRPLRAQLRPGEVGSRSGGVRSSLQFAVSAILFSANCQNGIYEVVAKRDVFCAAHVRGASQVVIIAPGRFSGKLLPTGISCRRDLCRPIPVTGTELAFRPRHLKP